MKGTLTGKVLTPHLHEGKPTAGSEVKLEVDQTLTQDATGTLAYLEFEEMDIPQVKTDLSVSYADHNTLQTDYRNPDDHNYLESIAEKYGLYFSKPGNGICHQLHLERFARPGKTLVGSDSHTPTAGGVGMIAIGMGGLDVASAMAGEPLTLECPEIVGVRLSGSLPQWVSAKDVILELLRRVGVEGGAGKIFEYFGPGIRSLTVPERATITNMGTETGATTSIFPSDQITKSWLEAQKRGDQWTEIKPDPDAGYHEVIEIDLAEVVPMVALPHSPGNVRRVAEIEGLPLEQVAIGSCTNSSLRDMKMVAKILKGEEVAKGLSLLVNSGSRQVVDHLVQTGDYNNLVNAGARILENACGPCIGMGGAPPSGGKTLRTYNRNFKGRSGTSDAEIYLSSPEVAAVSAIRGKLTDPRKWGTPPDITLPQTFRVNDNMIITPKPAEQAKNVEVQRGPNIQPLPDFPPLPSTLSGEVLLKVGDNITTDHIMPAGADILPLRSNIPAISKFVFSEVDQEFSARAKNEDGGFLVGGENYGQGSSREHAAIAPKYLGVEAVLAKSFSRIHRSNLINFGIVPLTGDTDWIEQGDELRIQLENLNTDYAEVQDETKGETCKFKHGLSSREKSILQSGGLLPHIREKHQE